MSNSFIYGLVDPLEPNHVRYVGLATREDRPYSHAKEACNSDRRLYRFDWIRKLLAEGREPSVLVLEEMSEDVSRRLLGFVESCYIKSLREIGHKLTNLTDGGEGTSGYRHKPETKALIGAASRGRERSKQELDFLKRANQKRAADPLWREGVSQRAKKRYEDEEFRKTFSRVMSDSYTSELRQRRSEDAKGNQNFLGKKHSEETCAKIGLASSQRSHDDRVTNGRKSWVTRRANGRGLSQRSPEERSETARKIWATRRARAAKKSEGDR